MLIECDPSIKSIIVNIDSDNHEFIIEDLDEERVVVKENMVALLKQKLEDVCTPQVLPVAFIVQVGRRSASPLHTAFVPISCTRLRFALQRLKENLPPEEESGSD